MTKFTGKYNDWTETSRSLRLVTTSDESQHVSVIMALVLAKMGCSKKLSEKYYRVNKAVIAEEMQEKEECSFIVRK